MTLESVLAEIAAAPAEQLARLAALAGTRTFQASKLTILRAARERCDLVERNVAATRRAARDVTRRPGLTAAIEDYLMPFAQLAMTVPENERLVRHANHITHAGGLKLSGAPNGGPRLRINSYTGSKALGVNVTLSAFVTTEAGAEPIFALTDHVTCSEGDVSLPRLTLGRALSRAQRVVDAAGMPGLLPLWRDHARRAGGAI